MSRTTRDLWLEDRQGVLDRRHDRTWWRCLRWVVSVGLVCAVATWGWRIPLAVAAAVATGVVLVVLVLLPEALSRATRPGQVTDAAVVTGLAAVGAGGLISSAGGWALLLLLSLTMTSPVVRRTLRGQGALLRCSVALARDVRARRPPYSSDDHGWP